MNVQEKLQEYYRHDGRKMKNLVDKILITYGGISQKDYDDFYSVANETIAKKILSYDDTRNFDTYIYSCIPNKIKTEMTRRNRLKRMADRASVSIDATLSEDENISGKDTMVASIDIEEEFLNQNLHKRMNNGGIALYEFVKNDQ